MTMFVRWCAASGLVLSLLLPAACDNRSTAPMADEDLTGTGLSAHSGQGDWWHLIVTPKVDTIVGVGGTLQLTATLQGSGEPVVGAEVNWTSLQASIAEVNPQGLVTALGLGTAQIVASAEKLADTALVVVVEPSGGEWDRVVENAEIEGDVVVPDGERWLIGANVRISGNVRTVGGTIGMRPGSSLRFVGASPDDYVGDGMRFGPEFAQDWGIWVNGSGVLDIRGTPKVGWNRTGSDPSWSPDDELWISPTDGGDYEPRRWFPGDPIPQIDPRVPAAEIINVTRDIVIEGPGHIHINSDQAQVIEYVTLRRMGIVNPRLGATTSRYALHLHHMGDGARGTVIRGVAAIDSEGRVFVPHRSHGITFEDVVSVNSFAEGFWWNVGGANASNDILVDRLAVSGVTAPRARTGQASRFAGVSLQAGVGNEIRNSAISGVRGGGTYSAGYDWSIRDGPPNVWTFEEDLVAHNNSAGTRIWTNNSQPHRVAGLTQYRNGQVGLDGAYNNAVDYVDLLAIQVNRGITAHAGADQNGKRFERMHIEAQGGPAITVEGHNTLAKRRMEFIDCSLIAGPGHPKILVGPRLNNPWIARFQDCGITPDDIVWENPSRTGAQGSSVIIEGSEGSWEVTVQNGQVTVSPR